MSSELAIPDAAIASRIYQVRSQRVMLDVDLARLYGVPTRQLNQQVKRNPDRFPKDFAFELTAKELVALRSQIVTSKTKGADGRGGRRTSPIAFTEHGVLMLSSVLNSERAVQVNIHIVRVFVRLSRLLASDAELALRLRRTEGRLDAHEGAIRELLEQVGQLGVEEQRPRKRLGYRGGGAV